MRKRKSVSRSAASLRGLLLMPFFLQASGHNHKARTYSEASVTQNKKVKNGRTKISAQTLSIHINSSMKFLSNHSLHNVLKCIQEYFGSLGKWTSICQCASFCT